MKGRQPAQNKGPDTERSNSSIADDITSTSYSPIASSSHHPPTSVSRHNILQLQRLIGNQAVVRLIQRQEAAADAEADVAAAPLDAAQVASALTWYAGQPGRYTPEIIQQIRGRVGRSAATGPLTADDVQAIAQWQIDNGIDAQDGKAGTTTLAAMFPTGLATEEAVQTYAGAAHGLEHEWQFLDPIQRQQRMEELINERLGAAGVPHVPTRVDPSMQAEGMMDVFEWEMVIAQHVLDNASGESLLTSGIPEIDFGDLVDTLYHEARHAEQTFAIARMLAGRGQSASYITHHLSLRDDSVAAAAVANPLAPGSMEALVAEGWYDSYYGRDAGETAHTYTRVLHALADREHSAEEAHEDPSDDTRETLEGAERRFDRAARPYEALPEEADAFRTGERAYDAYMLSDD